jgi:hypothetical protein
MELSRANYDAMMHRAIERVEAAGLDERRAAILIYQILDELYEALDEVTFEVFADVLKEDFGLMLDSEGDVIDDEDESDEGVMEYVAYDTKPSGGVREIIRDPSKDKVMEASKKHAMKKGVTVDVYAVDNEHGEWMLGAWYEDGDWSEV